MFQLKLTVFQNKISYLRYGKKIMYPSFFLIDKQHKSCGTYVLTAQWLLEPWKVFVYQIKYNPRIKGVSKKIIRHAGVLQRHKALICSVFTQISY